MSEVSEFRGRPPAELPEAPPGQTGPPISMVEFLEQVPPGVMQRVLLGSDVYTDGARLLSPDIRVYCDSEECAGVRLYKTSADQTVRVYLTNLFLLYMCKNCGKTRKEFAIRAWVEPKSHVGFAMKFGEIPAFGPPVPPRVLSLIGPDREIFLKGRRAENQGLGVGAFAYYRRVVENQKGRLLDQIIKVATRLGAPPDDIAHLEKAKNETQFSKAVEDAKDAIPDVLKVRGHNPLTLLHGPLSEGLHDLSDEECLELASDIRVVLYALAEGIAQALKDEQEVSQAVSRLLARRAKKVDESEGGEQ